MIVGYGEIGKSVHGLYEGKSKQDYTIITKDFGDSVEIDGIMYWSKAASDILRAYPIDILHVCIPWNKTFVKDVSRYIKKHEPELTIIHSTVPVGVTNEIDDETASITELVHSPVMGTHPDLTESMKTFRKIIGPLSQEGANLAVLHFLKLGVQCEIYDSPRESELAKLLSTSYYGWNIAFMQSAWETCDDLDVDFDQVYKRTNQIYNDGYKKFDKENVVRPILTYMGRGIGGHCVWENAMILKEEQMFEDVAEKIIELGKLRKKK